MPEYLAPGVYVEEVSFRSKSIEGVSTSTSAFAGLSRRGPLGVNPVLVTSFGDYQRVFGGLANLAPSGHDFLNYLAHAVRAYFDNGGSRLYVARVFNATDVAACCARSAASGIRFVARFPGAAGNGKIRLLPSFAAATVRAMDRAPQGTMVRTGVDDPQVAAFVTGGPMPANLSAAGHLLLRVGTTDVDIAITGGPVEAISDLIAEPLVVAANTTLHVRIDGGPDQAIAVPTSVTTRAALAALINSGVSGGYARITTAADASGENHLAIGSDMFGTAGSVFVAGLAALGFAADTTVPGSAGGNNVPNRRSVAAADLNALLAGHGVVASVNSAHRLVLTTSAVGTAAHINVRTGANSLHAAFGFAGTESDDGEGANPLAYFVKSGNQWTGPSGSLTWPQAQDLSLAPSGSNGAQFVALSVVSTDGDGLERQYQGLAFSPLHPQFIGNVLAPVPARQASALENLYAIETNSASPFALREALIPTEEEAVALLTGGTDGLEPIAANYQAALELFERREDISIVACPGESVFSAQHQAVQQALIAHCELRRAYRIAVLDTAPNDSLDDSRAERSRIDSTYAALYYPWVVVSNPLQQPGDDTIPQEITLPPSGFVCGVYARTDIQRGVFKAPANEVVLGALRFEVDVNFSQQEVLNPLGINCLRFLPGRGNRIWGARTASSDPEWKYVSVRRYFNYLERSVDVGTQWAVFEPNGERLWANIRETLSSFLFNEWRSGALLGSTAKEAFFVKCDRSTMDQNDLDNGRLVCLVGVAVVKPAEFVIFRIGQKTADSRN